MSDIPCGVKTSVQLSPLEVPGFVQYIGAFLTLSCNLNCSFCINEPEQKGDRKGYFANPNARKRLSPQQWAAALSRISSSNELPITLQGGEPTVYTHPQEKHAFFKIFQAIQRPQKFDLLTNLQFEPQEFISQLGEKLSMFQRKAPYPSIRVSYHPIEMNKVYNGQGLEMIINKAHALRKLGLSIHSDKAKSTLGVYMVAHPDNLPYEKSARQSCYENDIPFELKEFLGPLPDNEYSGTYLYPFSTNYAGQHIISSQCRTTEILIAPNGYIYRCHHDLYASAQEALPLPKADVLAFASWQESRELKQMAYPPVAHILDPELKIEHVFRPCSAYGKCIPCDTKVKNNRFQSLSDKGIAHTSVEIRDIHMPAELLGKLPADRQHLFNHLSHSKT